MPENLRHKSLINRKIWILLFAITSLVSCTGTEKKQEGNILLIKTDKGDMKVRLFDETPLHRDNFLKLTKEGFYDGTLFHRVIKEFMIQGGDPDSKNAKQDQQLGSGGPGYTIPAEFVPGLIHKKGVLSAARRGDQVNPQKESSGSQFYIVQGEKFSDEELDQLEEQINFKRAQNIFQELYKGKTEEIRKMQMNGQQEEFNNLLIQLEEEAMKRNKDDIFAFSPEQRNTYKTIGGAPHLDGAYTIFGEVIEGLEVLDSICTVSTNSFDRPLEDIKMEIEILK